MLTDRLKASAYGFIELLTICLYNWYIANMWDEVEQVLDNRIKELYYLWEFVYTYYNKNRKNLFEVTIKKQAYANQLYSGILVTAKHLIGIIVNYHEDAHASTPYLMRGLIEAAADLENLRYYNKYEDYMDAVSLNEEVSYLKYYEKSKLLERTNKDKLKEQLIASLPADYNKERISYTGYRFGKLKEMESNQKRHDKYYKYYDILCAHTHHNLHFINEDGLPVIADIENSLDAYYDIIASILKNGLINFVNICGKEIAEEDFKELKKQKRKVRKECNLG